MTYKQEIRFIVTNKCNHNCIFCHNEGTNREEDIVKTIQPADYQFISNTVSRCLSIRKFVLTGGEPLLAPNIVEIAKSIKDVEDLVQVNLITNGTLLTQKTELANILDEIHISLGTLNPELYNKRTQTEGHLPSVLESIDDVIGCYSKIKLNIVMIKQENKTKKNLKQIIEYAKKRFLDLYLIEIFPQSSPHHMPFSEIEKMLKELNFQRGHEKGVKVAYRKKGYPKINVVFIPCSFVASPLVDNASHFCKAHQAIYIKPDLTCQPCFLKEGQTISIKKAVKNRDEAQLIRKIKLIRANIGNDCPLL